MDDLLENLFLMSRLVTMIILGTSSLLLIIIGGKLVPQTISAEPSSSGVLAANS